MLVMSFVIYTGFMDEKLDDDNPGYSKLLRVEVEIIRLFTIDAKNFIEKKLLIFVIKTWRIICNQCVCV